MPNLYPHQKALIESIAQMDPTKQTIMTHGRRQGKSYAWRAVSYAKAMRLALQGQRVIYLCESMRACKWRFDEMSMILPPPMFIPNARQGAVFVAGDQGCVWLRSVNHPDAVYQARGNCGQIVFDPSMEPHTWSDQLWGRYREWRALADHKAQKYPE